MNDVGKAADLVDHLRYRARQHPDVMAFTFLERGEREAGSLTYAQLDRRARAMAALLQRRGVHGERVLLLMPPGLELVTALYACLYAGAVAVTTALPSRPGKDSLARILSIAADSLPRRRSSAG